MGNLSVHYVCDFSMSTWSKGIIGQTRTSRYTKCRIGCLGGVIIPCNQSQTVVIDCINFDLIIRQTFWAEKILNIIFYTMLHDPFSLFNIGTFRLFFSPLLYTAHDTALNLALCQNYKLFDWKSRLIYIQTSVLWIWHFPRFIYSILFLVYVDTESTIMQW